MLDLVYFYLIRLRIKFRCCFGFAYWVNFLKRLYVRIISRIFLSPILSRFCLFNIRYLLSILNLLKCSFFHSLILLIIPYYWRLSTTNRFLFELFIILTFTAFKIFMILIVKFLRRNYIILFAQLSDWCIKPQVDTSIYIILIKFTFLPLRLLYVNYVEISCIIKSLYLLLL